MKKKKQSVYGTPESYVGTKINHLTILRIINPEDCFSSCDAVCECDCGRLTRDDGTPIIIRLHNIVRGYTKSCGCIRSESAKKRYADHPMYVPEEDSGLFTGQERLYTVWLSMKKRCYNPHNKYYKYYGGRGIKVCKSWRDSYKAFKNWALANGYDPSAKKFDCMLDRINNNGDYKPSNCRWTNSSVQNSNKVNTLKYKYHNKELTARGWSKELGVSYEYVRDRLYQGKTIGGIIKEAKKNTEAQIAEE